jgi:hypothetical protein
MDKVIEQLRKEALPINDKCIGQNLGDLEKMLDTRNPTCTRIDPIEIFDIIDEETGQIDDEAAPEISLTDKACRCKAYAFPDSKWKNGPCPLATHIISVEEVERGKVRVGQQKQKKR